MLSAPQLCDANHPSKVKYSREMDITIPYVYTYVRIKVWNDMTYVSRRKKTSSLLDFGQLLLDISCPPPFYMETCWQSHQKFQKR
jgi:hypothetical protein